MMIYAWFATNSTCMLLQTNVTVPTFVGAPVAFDAFALATLVTK